MTPVNIVLPSEEDELWSIGRNDESWWRMPYRCIDDTIDTRNRNNVVIVTNRTRIDRDEVYGRQVPYLTDQRPYQPYDLI